MARVIREHWLIKGKSLRVYDEAECPNCGSIEELQENANFHQASFFPDVVGHITWSVMECKKCSLHYVYRQQWDDETQ